MQVLTWLGKGSRKLESMIRPMSMEAEQTAWLLSNGVPTTNSDAKYTWHVAPEAKVCMFLYFA